MIAPMPLARSPRPSRLALRPSESCRTRSMEQATSSVAARPSWAPSRAAPALSAARAAFSATSRTVAFISSMAVAVSVVRSCCRVVPFAAWATRSVRALPARATVSARSSSRSAASAMPSNRACSALAMACSASWRLRSASAALASAAARSEAISPKEASSLAAMAAMADMTPQVERPLAHRARALSKRPSATSRARAATVSGSAPSWFRMLRDRVRAVPMPMQRDRASRMYWRRKSLVRSPTTSVMRWPAALNCLSLRGSMRLARASVRASKSVIRTLPAARPSLM